jgi:hypothetical protein
MLGSKSQISTKWKGIETHLSHLQALRSSSVLALSAFHALHNPPVLVCTVDDTGSTCPPRGVLGMTKARAVSLLLSLRDISTRIDTNLDIENLFAANVIEKPGIGGDDTAKGGLQCKTTWKTGRC